MFKLSLPGLVGVFFMLFVLVVAAVNVLGNIFA
jgi:hypothetical protein